MSRGNSIKWSPLLDDKRARFEACRCHLQVIPAEPKFVEAFELLCRQQRQMYYTRLLGGLALNKVSAFARAVDKGCDLPPPNTVASLVYGATFAVFERLWNAGCNPQELVNTLAELHKSFPPVDAVSVRLLHEYGALDPLHHLFGAYCDALVASAVLVQHNAGGRSPAHVLTRSIDLSRETKADEFQDGLLAQVKDIVRENATEVQNQGSLYLKALEQAAQMKKKESLMPPVQVNGVMDKRSQHDATAHYINIRDLGKGSFGDVDEVQAVSGGERYARKRIFFYDDSAARGREKEVLREIEIMGKLNHQHIVMIRFWLQEKYVYSIFMKPVADCNLLTFFKQCCSAEYPEKLTDRIYAWFGCLLDGLNFAHRRGIMHRDIKPANILVEGDQIFLADFGSAKDVSNEMMTLDREYFLYGTPVYRAPETRAGGIPEPPADIFSLGCVFSEMLTVANRRELADFQKWRAAPTNECGPYAFKANLPKVKDWLYDFESEPRLPLARRIIINMTKEDPTSRTTAKAGIQELRSEEDLFFCEYH